MSENYIYRVAFNEPPLYNDSRTEFFFHSLAAIYEVFSPEQVGCKVSRLWNVGVSQGKTYIGRKCTITKEPIARKKRTNAPNSAPNSENDKTPAESI